MGVPWGFEFASKPERMIWWQPQVFCGSLVDESQSPRRTGVPCLNRKSVKGGLKIRLDGWICFI